MRESLTTDPSTPRLPRRRLQYTRKAAGCRQAVVLPHGGILLDAILWRSFAPVLRFTPQTFVPRRPAPLRHPLTTTLRRSEFVEGRQMPDEAILRQHAREALQTGRLPRRQPDRTWGGPGVGAPCAVCNQPVSRDEMEFEIQFEHGGATPGLDKFHVHLRCFAAWEMERTKPTKAGKQKPVK